jgi:hypothetical protein
METKKAIEEIKKYSEKYLNKELTPNSLHEKVVVSNLNLLVSMNFEEVGKLSMPLNINEFSKIENEDVDVLVTLKITKTTEVNMTLDKFKAAYPSLNLDSK